MASLNGGGDGLIFYVILSINLNPLEGNRYLLKEVFFCT